jgi:glycosyltransferase involved in cell wall biosynthesis
VFFSTVIPTIARPTLSRAVHSVLDQDFDVDEFEIIVVNDTGSPLPEADWQGFDCVHVINTNKRTQAVAYNTGASIAKGKFLHFLDDDDWMLPGAFGWLRHLTQQIKDAAWYYGGTQIVDRKGNYIIQLRHHLEGNIFAQVMAGEWVPQQSSLINTEAFFAVGGFNPLLKASEDIDLLRKIMLNGDIAYINEIVSAVGMGIEGSSAPRHLDSFYRQLAREDVINESIAFQRMQQSASSGFWKGRVVRVYLTSMVWNLQHRKWLIAVSRLIHGLSSCLIAGTNIIKKEFWHAILYNYKSRTFARGFRETGTK